MIIFASQGLRIGPPFSPPLADLEYILMIRALIFHCLRLPVHVSNQKAFYTEHMLSTKCKQRWHRNALIWQRFATSRFGSNENIFSVCQSFETFTFTFTSKLNLSQIKKISLGAANFQLSNIRITKRFWLAGDDDYLRGATSINRQVALRANFKMYSRSAKGGEGGPES
jgi:hypothetical protein